MVPPDQFILFAEQSDLIVALTQWSINATLRHAAALRRDDLSFAINLSTRALAHGGVAEQLSDALSIWNIAPNRVISEVTETALVDDFETTVRTLRQLRGMGMRVAIDDFGTGYASLTYLSRFPATDLKIDKTLIEPVTRDARSARLVESIVRLAHHLDMRVTAEGVADAEIDRVLAGMDCDFGQGYHLGMPQSARTFVENPLQDVPVASASAPE
jgi:EAL domain-containing protein (putative c-di-GMP-specific phosphodiesterase class I)